MPSKKKNHKKPVFLLSEFQVYKNNPLNIPIFLCTYCELTDLHNRTK